MQETGRQIQLFKKLVDNQGLTSGRKLTRRLMNTSVESTWKFFMQHLCIQC